MDELISYEDFLQRLHLVDSETARLIYDVYIYKKDTEQEDDKIIRKDE